MLSIFLQQSTTIIDQLNDDFMKAMMAKMKESKDTLLKSHNAIKSMYNQIGDEMRVAFDAQTLIINEVVSDLIDEMKLKHRRKMDLLRKATKGMMEIATHYGVSDRLCVKSEIGGGSIDLNDESLTDDARSTPVPFEDAPTECNDFGNRDNISTSLRDLYIPGVNLKCKICNTLFYFHPDFRNHYFINHGVQKPYQCTQCDVSYGKKGNFTKHIESIHEKITNYECHICRKRFYEKSVLKAHLNTHGEAGPYPCEQCGKTFKHRSSHYAHIRSVHNKIVRLHCNYCQKGYYKKSNLTAHLRTHTGEKPFECDTCNKSFSMKVSLKMHERTHSGEKPFHCNSCNKSFSVQSNLVRHERIHSGIKPYECSKCHKRFTGSSDRKRHERKCKK